MKIVNDDGEVVGYIDEGDRIIKAKKEVVEDESLIDLNKNENFVKVYTKTMFEVAKCLDGTTNQLLNFLIPFISYQTGIIQYQSNGKAINKAKIINLTGLNEKTVDRCIDKLIENKILGKHKTGREICYTANPFLFMKGSKVNKTLVKFFENSRWAKMYEEEKKDSEVVRQIKEMLFNK